MTAMKQMKLPFIEFEQDRPVNDNKPPVNEREATWRRFHAANPHVYDLLEKLAFQAIAAGHKTYGVKALFEIVRWHSTVRTTGNDFKLSNNHAPYYARLFHQQHPRHDGFFVTREVEGE
jgi:hypothetical protein